MHLQKLFNSTFLITLSGAFAMSVLTETMFLFYVFKLEIQITKFLFLPLLESTLLIGIIFLSALWTDPLKLG